MPPSSRIVSLVLSLAIAGLTASRSPAQCQYEVIGTFELPGCFGPSVASPAEINDNRVVVGSYTSCGDPRKAYLWTPEDGLVILLQPPDHTHFRLYDINAVGQAVGDIRFPGENNNRAVLWENGTIVDLGWLPGYNRSIASGINDEGTIVGASFDSVDGHPAPAIRWDARTRAMEVLDLPHGPRSIAVDVNERGQITGMMGVALQEHAFVMTNGVVTDLGVVPGAPHADPERISDRGDVVGDGHVGPRAFLAFIARAGQPIMEIPLREGYARNEAWDVNELGQVVGSMSEGPPGGSFAWIWQSGRLTNLEELIPPGYELRGSPRINNRGDIASGALGPDYIGAIFAPIRSRAGDVTLDCHVDMTDVLRVLTAWGECPDCLQDLDGDGRVDGADLLVLLGDWG